MAINKTRVQVRGTIGKSVLLGGGTTAGTVGAQIGVNLLLPNGSVPSLAQLAAALGLSNQNQPGNINPGTGGAPVGPVPFINLTLVPPNVIYPARPIPEEDSGEDPRIIPGPAGPRGFPGFAHRPFPDEDQGEDIRIIPGPIGLTGAAGQRAPWVWPDDPDDVQVIPGPQGIQGFQGFPGISVPADDGEDAPWIPGPAGPQGPPGGAGPVGIAWMVYPDDQDEEVVQQLPAGTIAGTFTATLATGCATAPTATWNYVIDAQRKYVTITTGTHAAVSNATGMTFTGLPSFLQPASIAQVVAVNIEDNGLNVAGAMQIAAGSGTLTCFCGTTSGTKLNYTATGFTATGTKGVNQTTFTYLLA